MSIMTKEMECMNGFTFCTEEGDESWTPVRKRVKKGIPLHLVKHLLMLKLLHHLLVTAVTLRVATSDSESPSANLVIPDYAAVNYS